MGWPVEMAPKFSDWARTLIKTNDPKEAAAACRKIADFVRGRINERRANPNDDFTSFVVTSQIEGRSLTEGVDSQPPSVRRVVQSVAELLFHVVHTHSILIIRYLANEVRLSERQKRAPCRRC
jgi:hypothetical protein